MYKIIILPLAMQDIKEAAQWYNKQQKGLGKRFTGEIKEKVDFIKNNPDATNIRYNNVRTAVLNSFPFIMHYHINQPENLILVTAVFHTSRDPEIWKSR